MPSLLSSFRTKIAKAILPQPQRRYPEYRPSVGPALGRSGLRMFYPGWIRDERLLELQGRRKYLVYKEMGDMNGYCAASLNAFAMFLRRADWRVDPVSDDNKVNGSAEFLESCMGDMEHSWRTFMAIASRMVPQHGFCPFEKCFKIRSGDNDDPALSSKFDDGRIGWSSFAVRAPETVFHWVWYPENPNRLRGLVQLTPPDYPPDLYIPVEKLIILRAEPGEENPEGRSVLRSSYKPFMTIKFMEDARNVIIEHAGTGTPMATVPPNISNPYVTDKDTGEILLNEDGSPQVDLVALDTLNSLKTVLQNMRLNEEPYLIVPAQFTEKGNKMFDITYLTNNGGAMIGDINNTIHEEGLKILMSTMTEFLALGTNATGGGSFALSRDKTDNFSLAITSYLDSFQESINSQAVRQLFRLNPEFDDLEVLPKIVHDPIIPININEVMAVLSGFKSHGWDLTKEANAEEIKNAVMDAVGLPKAAQKDAPDDSGETKPKEDSDVKIPA